MPSSESGEKDHANSAPGQEDPSYKVKNTFLEFSIPGDADAGSATRRRTRSDGTDLRHSPLVVAAKSPIGSPLLQPVDETMQAVPIDEVNFELLEEAAVVGNEPVVPSSSRFPEGGEAVAQATPGLGRDEPAYVVPTTPSPFLHSAFPPSVVPPFGNYGYGMPDMGLPPAYSTEGDTLQEGAEYDLQNVDLDGQFMQGMQFMPEMYDPNYGQYMSYGWGGVPVEGSSGLAAADAPEGSLDAPSGAGELFVPPSPPPEPNGHGSPPAPASVGIGAIAASGQETASPSSVPEDRKPPEMRSSKDSRRGKGRIREGREEERTERRASTVAVSGGGGGGGSGCGSGGKAERERDGGVQGAGDGGGSGAEGKDSNQETPSVYTTVMLRNIPNKYTREMLVKQLSVDFYGQFDFMYLPIDFKNKCNVGYGFINFRTVEACEKFVKDFHGVDVRKCLPGLNSKKVVEVTPARVQGLQENVRRLRNSPVMNQLLDHPEWMPLLFNDSGKEEPFPNPDQPLPPVKPRGRNREANARDPS
mmetsp:Transcript_74801/g.173283  ORF Transcript_74801/g.173283 Transcript_74801/m.173283 type:complete len:530 (+) Transcript_74801:234-1823(+)